MAIGRPQPRNSSIRSSRLPPECQPAAVDARLDRAQADPGHLGDLRVVEALDVEQDDRRALVVADRRQGGVERADALVRDHLALGVGLLAGRRLPRVVLELRIGLDGPPLPARWRSIAALIAIRLSQLLTLPPRKPARLR